MQIKIIKKGKLFTINTEKYGLLAKVEWSFLNNYGETLDGTVSDCKTTQSWREGDLVDVADIRPYESRGLTKYNIVLPKVDYRQPIVPGAAGSMKDAALLPKPETTLNNCEQVVQKLIQLSKSLEEIKQIVIRDLMDRR